MTDPQPVLLLEREVAKILRCSTATVKRLRLSGRLGYIPGRPVRIEESELAAYLARQRVPATQQTQPAVVHEVTTAERAKRDAVLRARRYWLKRRLR